MNWIHRFMANRLERRRAVHVAQAHMTWLNAELHPGDLYGLYPPDRTPPTKKAELSHAWYSRASTRKSDPGGVEVLIYRLRGVPGKALKQWVAEWHGERASALGRHVIGHIRESTAALEPGDPDGAAPGAARCVSSTRKAV